MTHSILIKRCFIFYIFLALITFTSCGDLKTDYSESLEWMTKTSGIKLPDNTTNLVLFNNHEWGMIVKFETTETIFKNFTLTNRMSQFNKKNRAMLLFDDIENLTFDKTSITNTSDFLIFTDCKTGNSWTLLAHIKTRTIWFEVLYADNGGDIAPCNKNTAANSSYK
jgi:hypothetical protein